MTFLAFAGEGQGLSENVGPIIVMIYNKIDKMKPTNPNPDTYIEGERQLSHFLSDIVLGHPDMRC